MDGSRADRILEEWSAVTDGARRPTAPPQRVAVRSASTGVTLAGASLALVVLIAAAVWLGLPGSTSPGGIVPTATPSATTVETPAATVTPVPTLGPCAPANVAVRIFLWEGAAGQRTAQLESTNIGSNPCTLEALERPQLIDGPPPGAVLIDGTTPTTTHLLTLEPGDVVKTLVQVGNYCGPAPVAPVSIAFIPREGARFIATPPTPTDVTIPPCLGSGQPATIGMQPWAP
jgi:uncharacterized protein DUF4232